MANLFKNVEITCKSTLKSMRKSVANLCVNHKKIVHFSEFPTFSPTFPNFSTTLLTTTLPLKINRLFHFFTNPTITTNNIKERI